MTTDDRDRHFSGQEDVLHGEVRASDANATVANASGAEGTGAPAGIPIPISQLKDDVLEGIIKEFVLREGTDYGLVTYALDTKITQVRSALVRGSAAVVFDPTTETCDIVTVEPGRRIF